MPSWRTAIWTTILRAVAPYADDDALESPHSTRFRRIHQLHDRLELMRIEVRSGCFHAVENVTKPASYAQPGERTTQLVRMHKPPFGETFGHALPLGHSLQYAARKSRYTPVEQTHARHLGSELSRSSRHGSDPTSTGPSRAKRSVDHRGAPPVAMGLFHARGFATTVPAASVLGLPPVPSS